MEEKIERLYVKYDPQIITNTILPTDNKQQCESKNRKQFKTCNGSYLFVETNRRMYLIFAPVGYEFDGATIPFGIGKGDMKLLIPALFHDIICENKVLVNYNRKLASTIFREALIKNHVNPIMANLMFIAVEVWQKLMCDWSKK